MLQPMRLPEDENEHVSASTPDFDSLLIISGGRLIELVEKEFKKGLLKKKWFKDLALSTAYYLFKKIEHKAFKDAVKKHYKSKNVKLGQLLFEFIHDERDEEWKAITEEKIIKVISHGRFSDEEVEGLLKVFEDKHEAMRNLILSRSRRKSA